MARGIAVDVLDEVWRRDSTPQDAACRYCGASVVHGVRRPAEAIRAHFDVVNPRLSATVDNVVVACPACNMRKGNRTPSEAGMTLLRAAQCESGVDRSAETDAAVKDAFAAAVRSLAPKPGGSGYNFDLPADHWVSQFADAVRAVVRDESDRVARDRYVSAIRQPERDLASSDDAERAAVLPVFGMAARVSPDGTVRGVAQLLYDWATHPLLREQVRLELPKGTVDPSECGVQDFAVRLASLDHPVELLDVFSGYPGAVRKVVLDLLHDSSPSSVCGASSVGDAGPSGGPSPAHPTEPDRRVEMARRRVALARRIAVRRRGELAVAEDRVSVAESALATALADSADYERLRASIRADVITHGPGVLNGHVTVSLHDDAGNPVLSITGADASQVHEAAAAIRAAESVAGA
ncbi:hypothetical protein WKY82_20165 [Gordonia malaquae]|uniref:HNH endonuclease n=1 Tax=Gordonia malaquae TaxID=410332 RepID=UPI0030C789D4